MDPNATLRLIEESIQSRERDEADETCMDLYDWLNRGGFEPDWDKYPVGTAYYRYGHIITSN